MTRQLFAWLLSLLLLTPAMVRAQEGLEEEYHKNIKVYQLKPILKKRRVELGVFGTATLNPRMIGNYGGGVLVQYHINEFFSVGAQYSKLFAFPSPMKDEVEGTFGLFPERTELGYVTTARFGVTPLFGKFGASKAPYWDLSIFVGGGVTQTVLTNVSPTFEAGLGFRFFMTKWLTITGELADLVYWERFQSGTTSMQNWTGRLGVTMFIPFSFKYGGEK